MPLKQGIIKEVRGIIKDWDTKKILDPKLKPKNVW